MNKTTSLLGIGMMIFFAWGNTGCHRMSKSEAEPQCDAAFPNRYSLGDARIPASIMEDGKKGRPGPMTPQEARQRALPCYAPGPHTYAFNPTTWCCE